MKPFTIQEAGKTGLIVEAEREDRCEKSKFVADLLSRQVSLVMNGGSMKRLPAPFA